MSYLIDAVTFLWMESAVQNLSKAARAVYERPESDLFLSAISAYEIVVKARLGQLELGAPADEFIARVRKKFNIAALAVTEECALAVRKLPLLHGDPFDRILIGQSIVHAMTIVTPDAKIAQYPTRVLW